MDNSAWNMYVFRDGRRVLPGRRLADALISTLTAINFSDEASAFAALVAAGELECALRDSEHPQADLAEQITDGIAEGLVRETWANSGAPFLPAVGRSGSVRTVARDPRALTQLAAQIHTEEDVHISVLEGFAYYALHPRKILRLLDSFDLGPMQATEASAPTNASSGPPACMGHHIAVIGIRSIGAPLSAVLAAALRARGITADRITVRPTGHPYDRVLSLGEKERAWVSAHRTDEFVLIDEGPGLSGSSFLATAEALLSAGIAAERIRMIGSRQPDLSQLRATNAAERWSRYRFHCLQSEPIMPADAVVPIGAGLWRREYLTNFDDQPSSWTALEMAKFLSHDRKRLYKFEGFGHFGCGIAERVRCLHAAGFSTAHHGNDCGFGRYDVESGRMLGRDDLSSALLHRTADYCAVRAREIAGDDTQPSQLGEMLRWNWQAEFDRELPLHSTDLAVEFPTVCDARMSPHEWLQVGDGRILKLDCGSHGDNHFFPGPCDIAWDLAGAIVEWKMDAPAREALVARYEQQSGDRVRSRLAAYELGYAVFRMAWSKMAAEASAGQFDEQLLRRDYLLYKEHVIDLAARPPRKPQLVSSKVPCALPEGNAA